MPSAYSKRSRKDLLAELAEERLKKLDLEYPNVESVQPANTNGEVILDFQHELSPKLLKPEHFRCYAARIEVACGASLRLVFSAPPQHGKTEVTLHGLVWICKTYPTKRHAYITYNQQRARRVAYKLKNYLRRAGIRVTGTLDCLNLPGGGQIVITSIDGGITGDPVDGVAIIDDPFKNRQEADSAARRAKVHESYTDNIETRVHEGASILVLATRWHPDDLSGRLVKSGWEYINLPAIAEGEDDINGREVGEPLFPEMNSLAFLEKKRSLVGEFTWAALYQGRPRPKGGVVFHEPTYYSSLPLVYRKALGVDLAYSVKTTSDMSICLEMWREERGFNLDGTKALPWFYIVRVDRKKQEAPDFAHLLKRRYQESKCRMLWRASGTEKGSADFIKRMGVPLAIIPPNGDKLVTSHEVSAAWNDGRVLVPDRDKFEVEEWIDAFLDIVANFTGMGKEHDDDVDAMGNAHYLLMGGDTEDSGDSKKEKPKKPRSEGRNLAFAPLGMRRPPLRAPLRWRPTPQPLHASGRSRSVTRCSMRRGMREELERTRAAIQMGQDVAQAGLTPPGNDVKRTPPQRTLSGCQSPC